jgi:hypothetical protein
VVTDGHLVDRLEWQANRVVTLDLPMHVEAEIEEAVWNPGVLRGGAGLEDGFDFVAEAETADARGITSRVTGQGIDGSVLVDVPHAWWHAVAPGPPGESARRFLLVRARGERGCITTAWSWTGPLDLRVPREGALEVSVAGVRYLHAGGDTWSVQDRDNVAVILRPAGGGRPVRKFPGCPQQRSVKRRSRSCAIETAPSAPLTARGDAFAMSWASALPSNGSHLAGGGSPTATVVIGRRLRTS